MTDTLTGVPNRRYFMQHLGRELKQTQRVGSTLSLLLLDLDHFKQINDQHGRAVGDEVLQELVGRMKAALPRESDWFARVGGEEFAVVLTHTPFTGAQLVAERLRAQIGHPAFKTAAGRLAITVSIGVSGTEAVPRSDTLTAERLLERADQCLYRSKDQGRNRVTIADAANRAAQPVRSGQ
jgi:diguanylate cyclase (GGDEF)-like protein